MEKNKNRKWKEWNYFKYLGNEKDKCRAQSKDLDIEAVLIPRSTKIPGFVTANWTEIRTQITDSEPIVLFIDIQWTLWIA